MKSETLKKSLENEEVCYPKNTILTGKRSGENDTVDKLHLPDWKIYNSTSFGSGSAAVFTTVWIRYRRSTDLDGIL